MARGLAVSMSLGLLGCAAAGFSIPPEQEGRLASHYVLAHEDGYPMRPNREPLTSDEYDARLDEVLNGIDRRATALWRDLPAGAVKPPLRVLLFVHGGLNGPRDDVDRMKRLLLDADPTDPRHPGSSFFARTTYYPIFVNWNASLPDSIADDLVFIRFGERVRGPKVVLGVLTAPFIVAARIVESVFRLPTAWWSSVDNFYDMRPGAADYAESLVLFPVRGLMTGALKAFGTSAWEIMKRRADLLVAESIRGSPTGVTRGAAQILLERLAARITHDPSECQMLGGPTPVLGCWRVKAGVGGVSGPVEFTFVGHSMGAIVVNRMLASRHDLPVRHVIYLAAASSIDEMELTAVPYKRRHPQVDLQAFTLSEQDEARERDPSGVLLPRGTLLVWIDTLFEAISTPGAKRFGRHKAYRQYYWAGRPDEFEVHEFADASEARPRRHGDFDELPYLERILCLVDGQAFRDQPCEAAADVVAAAPGPTPGW